MIEWMFFNRFTFKSWSSGSKKLYDNCYILTNLTEKTMSLLLSYMTNFCQRKIYEPIFKTKFVFCLIEGHFELKFRPFNYFLKLLLLSCLSIMPDSLFFI